MNTILMYVVSSENDIPSTILTNVAYYVAGKEIRVYDSQGKPQIFTIPTPKKEDGVLARLEKCEKDIGRVVSYLTSFGG